tara:strand:- start:23 stop:703 length:681 start_codon:yes stop_codon:yes gene_type:complete
MPYCTIEEAWSQSINPELLSENNSNYNSDLNSEIDLENSQLYDENSEKIEQKKTKKQKINNVSNMSRTYNRLSDHSGNNNRLKHESNKKLILNNKYKKKIANYSDKYPNYNNDDLPINEYNNNLFEKLDKRYKTKAYKHNMYDDDYDEDWDNTSHNDHYLLKLQNQIKYLNGIIAELKNKETYQNVPYYRNDKYKNDSMLDVIVYIFSGIMIILIMENITKLSRKI